MYKFKREAFRLIYKEKGFKQADIAIALGISIDTVKSWTRTDSKNGPDESNIKALAKFLSVKIEDIAEIDKDFIKTRTTMRPLIGAASCGVPTTYYYDGDIEMKSAPEGVNEHAYYIRADGDSMATRINHGDLLLCDPDAIVENGSIVHFEWDGEHGIKKYVEQGELRMMVAFNSDYPPLIITNEYELRMNRVIMRQEWI